jgi:hypothetical protein
MRIPDELRECVCFTRAEWPSGVAAMGTAFFVGVPIGQDRRPFIYVVTAKHCITGGVQAQRSQGGRPAEVVLLVNHSEHGRTETRTRASDWLLHDAADVAVLPLGSIDPSFEVRVWPTDEGVASELVVKEKNIGAGDDVFITGLLTYHRGATRNLPVVRLGSIAAMPEDPIGLETGLDTVTLVEVRSIGGLSGSPVFVHLSVLRDTPQGMFLRGGGGAAGSGGTSWLHGVMHGFYPTGKDDPDRAGENLNTGIAIVARIDRVLDLIQRPDQVAIRDEVSKRIEQELATAPVPTSTDQPEGTEFERFKALTEDLLHVPRAQPERNGGQT